MYADDANAVVLLDDQETTVRENGEIVTHQRLVYRIQRPEGKRYGICGVWFDQETKIHYLRGWSITAKGLPSRDFLLLRPQAKALPEILAISQRSPTFVSKVSQTGLD